jgi:pyridoxamine 5'-phosphate oxidase
MMSDPEENAITPLHDPFALFALWMADAEKSEINDPNGMALATATPGALPSVRMVLLKGFDDNGFVFYSHQTSRKGQELLANPHAALLFHWKSLRRQVRVEGLVSVVSVAEADEYFASRPRLSRLGAWASAQSQVLENRAVFLAKIAGVTARFLGREVPRPENWSGWRLAPQSMEFWQDMPFRLHDRVRYQRAAQGWHHDRLYP